ncbi:PCI domain protein, partial [Ancylostoma duodenale]
NHLETPVLDQAWVDQTTLKTANQLDFLLSEYKKQKDEGVKLTYRSAASPYSRAMAIATALLRQVGDKKFLESEPKLVELLQCIIKSQFGRALDILKEMKDRFLLDPYLSSHVDPLYAVIRERALLQYLEPFASADLNAMANVFRTDLKSLEGELVALCEQGQLSARIDAVGATIRMVLTDEREENYK